MVIGAVMNLSQSGHSVGGSLVQERWITDDLEHLELLDREEQLLGWHLPPICLQMLTTDETKHC